MAKAAKTENLVEQKLNALFNLQKIHSELDRIRTVRGELPLEVQDLEDEIAGLETRKTNLEEEVKSLEFEISAKKNSIADSEQLIKKYEGQQNKVRNNREFDSLSKEIEFQSLEIQLSEKRIKEFQFSVTGKKEALAETTNFLEGRKKDLELKNSELSEIVSETQKDEDDLMKEAAKAEKTIEDRLLKAYNRIRGNAVNGLAVVSIERDSCGGCFNKIPPQRQMDIKTHKKVIVCEHCGRILVDIAIEEEVSA
jgi:predicted  nucleic acid-binding Zn-ribbon protein